MESQPNLKALFLGDVVGRPGRRAVLFFLPQLIAQRQPDLVVVNAENAADDGLGLLLEHYSELRALGVDVVTTGNHVWEKTELNELLEKEDRLLRPANYPSRLPGRGLVIFTLERGPHIGTEVAVLNLQGRYRMSPIDDPFRAGFQLVEETRKKTKLIFIDFHAEDFSEKEAFPWAMDGTVTGVVGTHTHVATQDARILPRGCAAQTDLGMCGPLNSVIGSRPDLSIERSLTAVPLRNEVLEGPAEVRGLWIAADTETGCAVLVESLCLGPYGV
ncbi:MAG: TIGR00282 family metallophosphoesterase [Spirochaetales bacterium]|nr:TIGR00282 family metallophosphoesterase [Spirochaetales bacterium]